MLYVEDKNLFMSPLANIARPVGPYNQLAVNFAKNTRTYTKKFKDTKV